MAEVLERVTAVWTIWAPLVAAASILFVWRQTLARLVLITFLINLGAGMVLLSTFDVPGIYLALLHILVWTLLLVYLFRAYWVKQTIPQKSAFGIRSRAIYLPSAKAAPTSSA